MSYLSGFMLGSAIGKGIFDFLHGKRMCAKNKSNITQSFFLKAALSGRRRYYVKCLIDNHLLAQTLEKELLKTSYIKKVEINIMTGSLLLLYDEEKVKRLEGLIKALAERIFTYKGDVAQGASKKPMRQISLLGESIRRTFHAFNEKLLQKTRGYIDLRTLFSLTFVFRGLRRVLIYKDRVSGWQLMWWAFSLLSVGKIRLEEGISFN